jgi:hypothetical protein
MRHTAMENSAGFSLKVGVVRRTAHSAHSAHMARETAGQGTWH